MYVCVYVFPKVGARPLSNFFINSYISLFFLSLSLSLYANATLLCCNAALQSRYPNLIKYSVSESKQLIVDNAFVVKATLETAGDPVIVDPRYSMVGTKTRPKKGKTPAVCPVLYSSLCRLQRVFFLCVLLLLLLLYCGIRVAMVHMAEDFALC